MSTRQRSIVTCIMALLLVFSLALGALAAPAATGSQYVSQFSNTGFQATEQACYPTANQPPYRLSNRQAAALKPVQNGYPVQGVETTTMTSQEKQMLDLVNKERAAAGLPPLQEDAKLAQLVGLKARDMVQNNYYGHNSPTYGNMSSMLQ